jgi:protein ImuB
MASLSLLMQADAAPATRRRHLVLTLPYWATDCLRRAEPQLARPIVLWEKQQSAMRLAAVDARAAAKGLRPGQNLADARAQVQNLEVREIDRPRLEHIFADFADWHSNASPLVAVLADCAAYGDLCLDITGVAHLFGGEENMLQKLTGRLAALGFTVRGAIADTIGAAWALAHYAPGSIATAGLADILAPLPVAALRLAEPQIAALSHLGLKQVGQLYDRPRKALQARFGPTLLTRLDQALGRIEERLTPRLPIAEHFAERRFADPIGLIDDVLAAADDLAVQLACRLAAQGLGAQSFHLFLYLVDHQVISLSVNAARPIRDAAHIGSLFRHRAERLAGEYDPGFGIDLIRLGAGSLSELQSHQLAAFGSAESHEDLDKLVDRMASRLGPSAVLRSRLVDTHIPEQAVRLEPVIARTPDDPAAAPDPRRGRPLRLLPTPEPVTVTLAEVPDGPPPGMIWRRVSYRFVRSAGPERIGAEWWHPSHALSIDIETAPPRILVERGREKLERRIEQRRLPIPARDYFVAEDEAGRRFWLFRDGLYGAPEPPRWYLHGFFA